MPACIHSECPHRFIVVACFLSTCPLLSLCIMSSLFGSTFCSSPFQVVYSLSNYSLSASDHGTTNATFYFRVHSLILKAVGCPVLYGYLDGWIHFMSAESCQMCRSLNMWWFPFTAFIRQVCMKDYLALPRKVVYLYDSLSQWYHILIPLWGLYGHVRLHFILLEYVIRHVLALWSKVFCLINWKVSGKAVRRYHCKQVLILYLWCLLGMWAVDGLSKHEDDIWLYL